MEQTVLATIREILSAPVVSTGVRPLDERTGVYAAEFGVRRLEEEAARAARYHHPLSCLLFEPDGMEAVSQQHGPARGDRVLQDLGAMLQHAARPADVICRLEGDRFLLILPRLDTDGAKAFAERLRQRLTRHRFPVPGGPALTLTASAGIASVGVEPVGAEGLVQRALAALATAQAAGGDQVTLG